MMKTFLQCDASVKGDKLDNSSQLQSLGGGGGLVFLYLCENNLQKLLTKAITFIKAIVVLHIYSNTLGII